MAGKRARVERRLLATVFIYLALLAGGCGGASRYPVEGRVLLKGVPLKGKEGSVLFKPDASKGNQSKEPAVGMIQSDGTYRMATKGQSGAQPGWYKVTIIANEPGANPNEDSRRVAHPRYESEATTPLAVEVVANPDPGRYDLTLTR